MTRVSEKAALISQHPLPNCFSKELLMLVRGEGVWLEDRAGKRYLDFAGGIAVNALGYGRTDLADIARAQMVKLTHISNLFITEPALELAVKMLESSRRLSGREFQAVQFLSSGSEANETALKYARLYALRKKGPGAYKLLSFRGAFHGRTFGALSVTPNTKYQDPFQPLLGGLAAMEPEFAAALNRLCRQYDVILIADEVQTGLGRTGEFFASTGVGLEPDVVTLAKPLAGGLPLAAVLIPAKINSLIHSGEHGTTFGGGPVTTAVASRVWDLLSQPEFIAQVREKGEFLGERLKTLAEAFPFLGGSVRGRGLLRGIEVRTEALAGGESSDPMTALLEALRREGLLALRSGGDVLRIAPPLVISREELETGLSIMNRVLAHVQSGELRLEGGA
jgi:acetylornithine/N-succinyldiaminopimelate aminotransferase